MAGQVELFITALAFCIAVVGTGLNLLMMIDSSE